MDLSLNFNANKNSNLFQKDVNNFLKQNSAEQNKQPKSGVVIVKKGEAGYMKQMDYDDDGEVSLEEFSQYCDENGVSEKDKLTLMATIQSARLNQQIAQKTKEKQEEAKKEETDKETASNVESLSKEEEDYGVIYAKKGDEKYNEVMDENGNDVVTYEEYMKYCAKKAQNSDSSKQTKVEEEYSKSDNTEEEQSEVGVDVEA